MRKTEKTVYRSKIIAFLKANGGASYYTVIREVSKAPHGYLWEQEYSSRARSELRNMINNGIIEYKNSSLRLSGDGYKESA